MQRFSRKQRMRHFLAPLGLLGRDLNVLFSRPTALLGGLVGAVTICAMLVIAFVFPRGESRADAAKLRFVPGSLVRLSSPSSLPATEAQPADVQASRDGEVDGSMQATEAKLANTAQHSIDRPRTQKRQPSRSELPRNRQVSNDRGRGRSQELNGLPELSNLDVPPRNDPFADPRGWTQLHAEGDPWATQVMGALQGLEIPSFALRSVSGGYAFRLKVCKDGRVAGVRRMRSSGEPTVDQAVQAQLLQLKLPTPPEKLTARMRGCAELQYTFVWQPPAR